MKRTRVVFATFAVAIVVVACPWAVAQTAFYEPSATSVAVNTEPAPPGAATSDLPKPLATSVGSSDARDIQEAIDKFTALFETEDADLLKKDIWPSMNTRQYLAIKESFAVVSQVTLRETCPGSPTIARDSAQWTCNEMLGYYVRGKPRPWQTHSIQFRLKKTNGTWYVDGRRGN
jgi:hypothetical protein